MPSFLSTTNPLVESEELALEALAVTYQAAKAVYLPCNTQNSANSAATFAADQAMDAAQDNYTAKVALSAMALMMYNMMPNPTTLAALNAATAAESAALAAYGTAATAHAVAVANQLAYYTGTFQPAYNAWAAAKAAQNASYVTFRNRLGSVYAGVP